MNIAVFLPNWIGDVVMATPALRALRETYPQAKLFAVHKPYVAGVLEGLDWFDGHYTYGDKSCQQSLFSLGRELRRRRLDLAVLFPNTLRSALLAWLAGAKKRVGFVRYLRGPLLTDRLYYQRDHSGRFLPSPIIDDYNRLAERAGCAWPGYRMSLACTRADRETADRVCAENQIDPNAELICLNPGAAFGAAKHWPTAHFVALAKSLLARRACQVLVLAGPKERDLARDICTQVASPRVTSLADKPLSLGLTKACVERCSLLITTDSGPRHFALAFGKPVVTLFGPTHIAWTETYAEQAIHLQKQVPCGPCQQRVCPLDHRCMTELHPEEVYRAAEHLLTARCQRQQAG